jgi:hypothetical protein
MSLADAHRAVESVVEIERLNYLDDLWTAAFARSFDLSPDDIAAAVGIGKQMLALLRGIRYEVGWVREFIASDPERFNTRAEQLLMDSQARNQRTSMELAELFRMRGWHIEADEALRAIEESEPVEQTLDAEIGRLAGGEMAAGDFQLSFKCSLFIAGSAIIIVSTILTPGAAMAAIGESAVFAAHMPDICRGLIRDRARAAGVG